MFLLKHSIDINKTTLRCRFLLQILA